MTKYFLDDFNTAVAYIEYYFNIRLYLSGYGTPTTACYF